MTATTASSVRKVGIYGGRSYTGIELLHWLERHPGVEVAFVTSAGASGDRLDELEPGAPAYVLLSPEEARPAEVDLVFLCLPHGRAAATASACLRAGTRVVDLSGDHRLRDEELHASVYGSPRDPTHAQLAVYGLPELRREDCREVGLVANPGCYPTAVSAALAPLARRGWISGTVIVDAKSGVSGAGRTPSEKSSFCSAAGDVRPYAPGRAHRHVPEMEQALVDAGADPEEFRMVFVPQLVPAERGILATLYVSLGSRDPAEVRRAYREDFAEEEFLELLPEGRESRMRAVRGTNRVQVSLHPVPESDLLVICSALDNLVKGAAGQAIQNMNRMFGLDEGLGLDRAPCGAAR